MIQVPGPAWEALHKREIGKSPVRVSLNNPNDPSSPEKIYLDQWEPKLSTVISQVRFLPTGWRPSKTVLTLLNDGSLNAFADGTILGNDPTGQSGYYRALSGHAEIMAVQYVQGVDGELYPVDVYTGAIEGMEWSGDGETLRLRCVDLLTRSLSIALKSSFDVARDKNLWEIADQFLIDHCGFPAFPERRNADRWWYLRQVMEDLQWYGVGHYEEGTKALNVYNALCRSCICQPVQREDGTLDWVHEWPRNLPLEVVSRGPDPGQDVPGTIGPDFVKGGGLVRQDGNITGVRVDHQNVSDHYDLRIDTSKYRNEGILPYSAPLISGLRQAGVIEGLLEPIVDGPTDTTKFRSPGIGMVMQLGDTFPYQYQDEIRTYRVLGKRWTETFVDIEAVRYRQNEYVNGREWWKWNSQWDAGGYWL